MNEPSIKTLLAQGYAALQASSPTAQLDTDVLLAYVLNTTRTYLHTWPDRRVSADEVAHWQTLLQRRQCGEPIAYLIHQQEFWSLPLRVTPATLIPRPETEILVQTVLTLPLSSTASLTVVDVGTGSAAIALALATEKPHWSFYGVDISDTALHVAQMNARNLHLSVGWLQSDGLMAIASTCCDIIVSNPPYVASRDPHLQQGDVRFEPQLALDGGITGLDVITHIIHDAPRVLKKGGWIIFEHGYQQGAAVRQLLQQAQFQHVETVLDLAGHERVTRACLCA